MPALGREACVSAQLSSCSRTPTSLCPYRHFDDLTQAARFPSCRECKLGGTIRKARCGLLMGRTRRFYEKPSVVHPTADAPEILGPHAARVGRALGREKSHPHSPNRSRQASSQPRDRARLPGDLRVTPGNHVSACVHGLRRTNDAKHLPSSRGALTDYQFLGKSQTGASRRRNEARH